jgi:hypothetical protein
MQNWIALFLAAARHSPEALSFVKSLDTNAIDRYAAKDRYAANRLVSLIIEDELPYEVTFQCTSDTVAFETVLETLSGMCPNWKLSPRCYYYAMGYHDKQTPNHKALKEQTARRKTQDAHYERLIVCVNQNAAAMLKMYDDIVLEVNDYSDIMEKYS